MLPRSGTLSEEDTRRHQHPPLEHGRQRDPTGGQEGCYCMRKVGKQCGVHGSCRDVKESATGNNEGRNNVPWNNREQRGTMGNNTVQCGTYEDVRGMGQQGAMRCNEEQLTPIPPRWRGGLNPLRTFSASLDLQR